MLLDNKPGSNANVITHFNAKHTSPYRIVCMNKALVILFFVLGFFFSVLSLQSQNCGWTNVKHFGRSFVSPSQVERHQRLFASTPVCLRITWNSQHYLAGRCNTTPVSAVRRFHRNSCWRWRSSSLGNMMSQTGLTSAFDALNAASIHRYNAATDTETPRTDGRTDRQQTDTRPASPPSQFRCIPDFDTRRPQRRTLGCRANQLVHFSLRL